MEAAAGCETAARAFFGRVLGLPELRKPAALRARGGAWFALPDGRQLHVGVTADFVRRVKGHLALRCDDLAGLQFHLHGRGVPFQADDEAGLPRIFLRDPFGNRLEIVQNMHASIPVNWPVQRPPKV